MFAAFKIPRRSTALLPLATSVSSCSGINCHERNNNASVRAIGRQEVYNESIGLADGRQKMH